MPPIHDSTGPSSEAVNTVLGNLEQQQRQQAQSQATSGGDWLEAAIDGLELAVDSVVDAEAIFEGVTDALGSVAEVAGGALGGVAEAAGEAMGGVAGAAGEAIAGLAGGLLEGLLG